MVSPGDIKTLAARMTIGAGEDNSGGSGPHLVDLRSRDTNQMLTWLRTMDSLRAGIA